MLVVILVIVIAFAGYYLVPVIARKLHHPKTQNAAKTPGIVTVPTGDPTTRDTDGDGVSDWQEILVGLDPRNPETRKGTPDAVTFQSIKDQVGVDAFNQAASQVTDTDKVALALYDGFSKNAENRGQSTGQDVSTVTQSEILNYISSKKSANKVYGAGDLTMTDNTSDSVKAYYSALKKTSINIITQDFSTHLSNYLQGSEGRSVYFDKELATIRKTVSDSVSITVPTTAVANHLALVNGLYGILQTLDQYDPTTTDSLVQFGTMGLIQDYINQEVAANASITFYFSVALDSGSKNQ